jgi:hypothetical protein
VGADVAVHAYSFRDAVVDEAGTGGIAEAMPFVRLTTGLGFVEGHGGWRGHVLSLAGGRDTRRVLETGARAGYGLHVRVEGNAKWVHAPEGTFPFAGVGATYGGSPVQAWAHTGKWLHADVNQWDWGGGLAVTLGGRFSVWANVRQQAPDPLYWNTTRRTWSVGATRRLGRVAPPIRPVRAATSGAVSVTLALADAPSGQISIAGDFNNWEPAPMELRDDHWIVRLPLGPGVYHYAFRSAAGVWFVPPSTPGRRDDGMGGQVAVLMVN